MTRWDGGAQAAVTRPTIAITRPISALISAALLLLTVVAGVGGVGGFAGLGKTAAASAGTTAPATTTTPAVAASTIAVPLAGDRRTAPTGDRRAAPALGTPSSQQHTAGWAPHHPEAAHVPAIGWQQPIGLTHLAVEAGPAVIALTIQVSHRGRAPPAGSLLT